MLMPWAYPPWLPFDQICAIKLPAMSAAIAVSPCFSASTISLILESLPVRQFCSGSRPNHVKRHLEHSGSPKEMPATVHSGHSSGDRKSSFAFVTSPALQ